MEAHNLRTRYNRTQCLEGAIHIRAGYDCSWRRDQRALKGSSIQRSISETALWINLKYQSKMTSACETACKHGVFYAHATNNWTPPALFGQKCQWFPLSWFVVDSSVTSIKKKSSFGFTFWHEWNVFVLPWNCSKISCFASPSRDKSGVNPCSSNWLRKSSSALPLYICGYVYTCICGI